MTGERGRGVLLYTLSAVLLLGGGLWFFRTAPPSGDDPQVDAWRNRASALLPDVPLEVMADTIVMAGDISTQRNASVDGGSYTLSMVCLGERGQVRVRLSTSGNDSGRAVRCAGKPASVSLTVALADHFFMLVSAETEGGTAVFRWRLDRGRGL